MKHKLFHRSLAVLLAFAMLASLLPGITLAADERQTIAAWEFTSDQNGAAAIPATTGAGSLTHSAGDAISVTSAGRASHSKWTTESYWLLSGLSCAGWEDLQLSFKASGSNTGPANWIVEYAADGSTWMALTTYSISSSTASPTVTATLPQDAAVDGLSLRIRPTDDVSINGSTVGTGGTSRLEAISLTAASAGSTDPGDPTTPTDPETTVPDPTDPTTPSEPTPSTETGTVAAWAFTEAASLPAQATTGWGTLTHSAETYASYSSKALSLTGWSVGSYWQLVTNTTGCTEMSLKLQLASSSTGPLNFSLRYSTDLGETWTEFATLSLTSSVKYYTVTLPDGAQSDNLVLRLVTADDVSVGGDVIKNGGSSKINNITLTAAIDAAARQPDPETPAYPEDWQVGSGYNVDDVFVPENDDAATVTTFTTDETNRRVLAQWGGNTNYGRDLLVYGDLYTANDRLDGRAKLTTVVAGETVAPGFSTSSTNSTNYYLGSSNPCVGSGGDQTDYIQLHVSTAKYADLSLSFRLRASGKGPAEFYAKYSTDGETWQSFSTGTYSYAYTAYGYGGTTYDVTGEGDITGGVLPMEIDSNYINFTLDVPEGAENAKDLYIRLYASSTCITPSSTGSTVTASASLRIDTISLTGCPMESPEICRWVQADAQGAVAQGYALTLTSATEGAKIYYSTDSGKTVQVYDPENKPVLDTFPQAIRVWAEKDGLSSSVKTDYYYTQAQVESVRATPNGGAVAADTQIKLTCATPESVLEYSFDGGVTWQTYDPESRPVLTEELLSQGCTMEVRAVKPGYISSPVSSLSFTLRLNATYNLYFGQVHSHTNYSDGAGSCEEAYQHASAVDNLDFLAVTDHSNAFDNDTAATIMDGSVSTKWVSGHALADQYTTDDFVCIYGFEMTWSNGLGHMNTYNSNGFLSRTQSEFSSYSTALQNYYAALKTDTNTISQFNHPGTTFGTFQDYAYFDEQIDQLITLIEVGNGEGTIGSSGYFPSYEEYTRALDLGWHVAPTNNQDNHKGSWGDANTARTVIMADSLTRNNIYDAIRNRRVYATEDNDFNIYYTLDGYEMGAILTGEDVGDTLTLSADISDATDSGNCKVDVIVNGGLVAASKSVSVKESTVEFDLPANYSYYYLKIVQADGDIAVTAPVWIGEVEAIGVSGLSTDTELPVSGEPISLTLDLYNNETANLDISSIQFTADGEVIHTVDLAQEGLLTLPVGTASYTFSYTHNGVGAVTLGVTVTGTYNGVEKQYNGVLQLDYIPGAMLTNVLVDGTHGNDYVTGSYSGNYTKLVSLGADNFARVTVETQEITAQMLEDCQLLLISSPAKRTLDGYKTSHFSDAFIQLVADYVAGGGTVVLCGAADYNDSTACQSHTEINKLLTAIGSTLRLRSDEVGEKNDDGTVSYGLSLSNYDQSSPWLSGAEDGMAYSLYSACSVDMGQEGDTDQVYAPQALIYGGENTFSVDMKTDTGYAVEGDVEVVPAGQVVAAAVQETKAGGYIFVAGSAFFSDYSMETDENALQLNGLLMQNILQTVAKQLPVTPIAQMRQGNMGDVFCVEGYVTAGTDNEYNTFFDTVYIQDETGGVTIYPFSEDGLALGTKVQIVGYVDAYQDDLELQVLRYQILEEEPQIIQPKVLSAAQAMDYATYGGQLVQTTGTIVDISYQGTSVTQLKVKDAQGDIATIFIDGYIYSGTTGKNELASFCQLGATVTAAGMCFMHPETGAEISTCCLRVRNCDEITLAAHTHVPELVNAVSPTCTEPGYTGDSVCSICGQTLQTGQTIAALGHDMVVTTVAPTETEQGYDLHTCSRCGESYKDNFVDPLPPTDPCEGYTDVNRNAWYHSAVDYVIVNNLMGSTSSSAKLFAPNNTVSRAMVATILWRQAGQPAAEGTKSFPDVQVGTWYADAVAWCGETGIINGYGNGNFGPNDPITREQLAALLRRYAEKQLHQDVSAQADLDRFSDGASISGWAKADMAWAVSLELIRGKDTSATPALAPLDQASRAELAQILQRFLTQ